MIINSFYINQDIDMAIKLTGLALDEIESIVGRFRKSHYCKAGQLKGEVRVNSLGNCSIHHHFTKKKLWESEI